ncbi:TraR/DksA family transcriptional regulator [Reinekea sp.]|uniref:TraR/DksA family transcriptional regulator n=1 Tax=Reinekea sp. TaxID=1970455 RepID=UPI002A82FC2F|nr:TraR/DksA family transcriptional regulator [Reinekea sp.]
MLPEQMNPFRTQLLALKGELVSALATGASDIKPVALDQTAMGRVSRVDAMQMQQMALESARRRERQLISIDQALERLDKQTYGLCVGCDEGINVRRLQINPTASRCIKCAEALSQ